MEHRIKRSILGFLLLVNPVLSQADDTTSNTSYLWGDGRIGSGASLAIAGSDGRWGWELNHSLIKGIDFGQSDHREDRTTGDNLHNDISGTSLALLYHRPYKQRAVSFRVGAGWYEGAWTENCKDVEASGIGAIAGPSQECDKLEVADPGLVLGTDVTWGKRLGIGVYADMIVFSKFAALNLGLTLRFGNFAL
jgi:hypothetical protein